MLPTYKDDDEESSSDGRSPVEHQTEPVSYKLRVGVSRHDLRGKYEPNRTSQLQGKDNSKG